MKSYDGFRTIIKVVTSEKVFHAITPKVSFAVTLTSRHTLPHRRPYIKY